MNVILNFKYLMSFFTKKITVLIEPLIFQVMMEYFPFPSLLYTLADIVFASISIDIKCSSIWM